LAPRQILPLINMFANFVNQGIGGNAIPGFERQFCLLGTAPAGRWNWHDLEAFATASKLLASRLSFPTEFVVPSWGFEWRRDNRIVGKRH
jgi:hypothetical protein